MKYERLRYPDGQISVKITDYSAPYEVKERINSYEDLFFLRALADAMQQDHVIHLTIPCLFGQRADRRFSPNQSLDLKLIAEVINACKFRKVVILDPHSDISTLLIDKSVKWSSESFVSNAIDDAWQDENREFVLVSPDVGAYKKVFEYGEKFHLPVLAAVKHRDLAGRIDLQFIGDVKGKECLIVDDLCDGGYTFITLAKKLKEQGAARVCLYITHAYFSKGLDVLKENIDHVFCTNSVKDVSDPFVTQYKVIK